MKRVEITFKADIDDDFLEVLEKVVDHHLDYLVDLDGYPEIKTVYDAKVEVISNENNN